MRYIFRGVLLTLIISIFTVSAFADSYEVSISEPSTSYNDGYLIVELENNSSGVRSTRIFFWSIVPQGEYNSSSGASLVINSDSISITPYTAGTTSDLGFYYTLTQYYTVSDYFSTAKTGFFSNGGGEWSTSYNTYTVVGFSYSGSIAKVSSNIPTSTRTVPQVVWGTDSAILTELEKITSVLRDILSSEETYSTEALQWFNDIYVKLNAANNNLIDIEDLSEDILSKLGTLQTAIVNKLTSVSTAITDKLDELIDTFNDTFNKEGSESTSNIDDSSIHQNESVEEDIENNEYYNSDLGSISMTNPSASDFATPIAYIWNVTENVIDTNPLIKSMILYCLVISICAFCIGRG